MKKNAAHLLKNAPVSDFWSLGGNRRSMQIMNELMPRRPLFYDSTRKYDQAGKKMSTER